MQHRILRVICDPRKGLGGFVNYLKSGLGYQRAGSVIVVELDGAASDVFLVDDLNLRKLERGDDFAYYGGHATRSPVHLDVPSSGSWNVVVIPSGRVSVSASVIPAA
jgi:hypothetical protein